MDHRVKNIYTYMLRPPDEDSLTIITAFKYPEFKGNWNQWLNQYSTNPTFEFYNIKEFVNKLLRELKDEARS